MKVALSHEFLLPGYRRKDIVQVPATLARLLNCDWCYISRPSQHVVEISEASAAHFVCGEHGETNRELIQRGDDTAATFTRAFAACAGWKAGEFADLYVTMFLSMRTALAATLYRIRRALKRQSSFVYVKADLSISGREHIESKLKSGPFSRLKHYITDMWLSLVLDLVSVESADAQQWLSPVFGRISRKTIVVRNCPAVNASGPLPKVNRERKIIAVSRLGDYVKATDILLPAFRLFSSSRPEWKLILVGKSSQRLSVLLESYKDMLEDGRIVYEGYVDDPLKLGSLYRSSAVFVHPSRRESVPTVLMEAIRGGCLPLCTPVFPVEEVLGKYTGELTFPVDDIKALAAALSRLAQRETEWSEIREYLAERTRTWNWDDQLAPVARAFRDSER